MPPTEPVSDAIVPGSLGEVDAEFEELLADWARRYQGDPRQELVRLLTLALEREQIVAVAYTDEVIERRVATLTVGSRLREVIRRGLAWAWRDEEMHAIYTRGVLMRIAPAHVRLLAWFGQLAGAIGGWAAAVRQHTPLRRAPLARTLATLFVLAGRLAGKVPRSVGPDLRYVSFQRYCELQAQAEQTAARAWERVSELAPLVPDLPPGADREFRKMWHDEARHRRLFELLGRSLTAGDAPREDTDAIVDGVRQIGELFLPRALRRGPLADHPLGRGGPVIVRTSAPGEDKREALRRVLADADLAAAVRDACERTGKPAGELRVVIKASFMLGYDRRARAHVLDVELLDELAAALQALGCVDLAVAEGGNLYGQFFANRSVAQVAAVLGYDSPRYRVVDLDASQEPHTYSRGMAQSTAAAVWRDADLRLVFSKMRSHPTDQTHLTLSTMQGVGAQLENFLFAERLADRETALLMPLADFPPHFALIDAFDAAADGLVGVLGCRRPPRPRRLYAGADALAVDLVASRHMGVRDARRIPLLRAAFDWFGDPRESLTVHGDDSPIAGFRGPHHTELTALLGLLAYPVYQFASGRGSAFLPPMDRDAFPPLPTTHAGPTLRLYRALMQRLIGLR